MGTLRRPTVFRYRRFFGDYAVSSPVHSCFSNLRFLSSVRFSSQVFHDALRLTIPEFCMIPPLFVCFVSKSEYLLHHSHSEIAVSVSSLPHYLLICHSTSIFRYGAFYEHQLLLLLPSCFAPIRRIQKVFNSEGTLRRPTVFRYHWYSGECAVFTLSCIFQPPRKNVGNNSELERE